ncbi:MAG: hypothetical protein OHK0029_00780 [Armatimonadaceae bacterium]
MAQLQQTLSEDTGFTAPSRSRPPTITAESSPMAAEAAVAATTETAETAETSDTLPTSSVSSQDIYQEVPCALRHVRTDELLAALNAIEVRKGSAVVSSVPLGAALDKMQADTTPEEVWQEIYVQRLQQRKESTAERLQKQQERKRRFQIATALGAILVTAFSLRLLFGDVKGQAGSADTNGQISPSPMIPPTNTGTFGERQAEQITALPEMRRWEPTSANVFRKTPATVTLAQFPENRTMWLRLHDIQTLSTHFSGNGQLKPLTSTQLQETLFTPSEPARSDFPMVYQNGKVYIRGWVAAEPGMTQTTLVARRLTMYNRPEHPELTGKIPVQVTILGKGINGYQASSQDGEFSRLSTSLQRLDDRVFERWEAPPLPEKRGLNYSMSQSGSPIPNP